MSMEDAKICSGTTRTQGCRSTQGQRHAEAWRFGEKERNAKVGRRASAEPCSRLQVRLWRLRWRGWVVVQCWLRRLDVRVRLGRHRAILWLRNLRLLLLLGCGQHRHVHLAARLRVIKHLWRSVIRKPSTFRSCHGAQASMGDAASGGGAPRGCASPCYGGHLWKVGEARGIWPARIHWPKAC